jgi:PPOX class probable FMN-dependent enzyme
MAPFEHTITTDGALRELYKHPSDGLLKKKVGRIDEKTARYIASSPFVLLATADADGRCDVSPRGGPPGFVKVLDERRLAVPDLSGNNILDSLTNVLANPHAGLLFVHPGHDDTLRLEGEAHLTTDPEILGLWDDEVRRPKVAIGIEVTTTYVHCAKAFRRGEVWQPGSWDRVESPDTCELVVGHLGLDLDPQLVRDDLERGYVAALAEERDTSANRA